MTFRSTIAKTALAGVAGIMALTAIPSVAGAQPYGGYYGERSYSYDPCRRDSTNRGTTGALVGGALGAVIGSNAAARNARTEGALLGGALGAAIGAGVGKSSAACNSGYRSSDYYGDRYYGDRSYGDRSYGDRSYGDRSYGDGYYGDRYRRDGYYRGSYDRYGRGDDDYGYGYAYDRRGSRYAVTERAGADGCTLAESPIYLPDGRVQKRFVRVCMDANGNYQVVD